MDELLGTNTFTAQGLSLEQVIELYQGEPFSDETKTSARHTLRVWHWDANPLNWVRHATYHPRGNPKHRKPQHRKDSPLDEVTDAIRWIRELSRLTNGALPYRHAK